MDLRGKMVQVSHRARIAEDSGLGDESEVADFHKPFGRTQDVPGLDVTMKQVLHVETLESECNLSRNLPDAPSRHRASLIQRLQGPARTELHDEQDCILTIGCDNMMNANYVAMIRQGEELPFSHEPISPGSPGRIGLSWLLLHNLHGNSAVESISPLEDGTKVALADLGTNLEAGP